MRCLYIKGDAQLSEQLREKYRGCRIENADAFDGVAQSVTEAEVVGDYPAILAALIDAGVAVTGAPAESAELFDVYKLTDGERGKRASKANISQEEAEQYVSERPDDTYEIVLSE